MAHSKDIGQSTDMTVTTPASRSPTPAVTAHLTDYPLNTSSAPSLPMPLASDHLTTVSSISHHASEIAPPTNSMESKFPDSETKASATSDKSIVATPASNAPPAESQPQNPLLDLPNELLDKIYDSADSLDDVFNFRLAHRHLRDIGANWLQKHFSTIILDVSQDSMDRFHDICTSDLYRKGVKKIIFFAALHADEPEDLEQHESLWQDCDDETKKFVMEEYAERFDEQQDVLWAGGIEEVLLEAVECFPKLETIRYTASLRGFGEWEDAQELDPKAPVLNKDQIWLRQEYHKGFLVGSDKAPDRSDKLEEILRRGTYQRWHCPSAAIQAVAKHAKLYPTKPLSLELDQFASPFLSGAFATWMDHKNDVLRRAMGHVKSLKVFFTDMYHCEWDDKVHNDEGNVSWNEFREIDSKLLVDARTRWHGFLSPARGSVETLNLSGRGAQSKFLLKTVLQDLKFLRLRNLHISPEMHRFLDEEVSARHSKIFKLAHSIDVMVDFLMRHGRTLRRLSLDRATGAAGDKSLRPASADELQSMLNLLKCKNEFPILENASIIEECVFFRVLGDEIFLPDYDEIEEGPELEFEKESKAIVAGSAIGQLAKELGILGEWTSTVVGTCGWDFGNWVLGKAHGVVCGIEVGVKNADCWTPSYRLNHHTE